MLTDELKELLTERLVKRIEDVNLSILKDLGNKLDEIGTLKPTDQMKLANILNYGGDYKKVVAELERTTKLNAREIEEIIDKVAEQNYINAKHLYQLKNIGYIPYNENEELRRQINAIKKITKDTYMNLSRAKVLGFTTRDRNGNVIFRDISDTYKNTIDEAVMAVYQGKENFDKYARKIIKELGGSGLKYVDYESGLSRRLDSAVRMNMQGALRDLENEMQLEIGEQTGCNGVEISVHENPATDHEPIQGHQFDLDNFKKMQKSEPFKDVNGNSYTLIKRHIGEYNCYHNIFAITIGVDEPMYSQKQLDEIIKRNNELTEIDGKKYTKYEVTQIQRKLETEIRKQKDIQVMARSANQPDVAQEAQTKINKLTAKYKEISNKAEIPTRLERYRVAGYNKIKVKENSIKVSIKPKTLETKPIEDKYTFTISKEKQLKQYNDKLKPLKEDLKKTRKNIEENLALMKKYGIDKSSGSYMAVEYRHDIQKKKELKQKIAELGEPNFEDKTITIKDYDTCKELLSYSNITLEEDMKDFDSKLLLENTAQLHNLTEKYPTVQSEFARSKLDVFSDNIGSTTYAQTTGRYLEYNTKYFADYEKVKNSHISDAEDNWHYDVGEKNSTIYTTTHEFGHILGHRYQEAYNRSHSKFMGWKDFDSMLMSGIYSKAKRKTGLSITELKNKYLTDYGKSKRNFEAFAEIFAGMELGVENPLTDAMKEYIEVMNEWM